MDVTLIVPTFRETANIEPLVKRVFAAATAGHPWSLEMLIVDDRSPDGTAEKARQIAEREGFPMRVLERDGPRGLAISVLDGFFATTAPVLAVMDADLSHPPEALPSLVGPILAGAADFAIGSRYVEGGATAGWGRHRKIESSIGTVLCRPLCRTVRDPLSGYFAIRRSALPARSLLSPRGYKIGLELLVKAEKLRVAEIPIEFRDRHAGQSKLGLKNQFAYLRHLAALYRYRFFARRTIHELSPRSRSVPSPAERVH